MGDEANVRDGALQHERMRVALVVPAIGAEIAGLDLGMLDEALFDAIHRALVTHHVIFFRDQRLEKSDLVAFARRFGEPQQASESSFGKLDGFPEIDVLDYDGERPPYVTKEMWHTDFSGREQPTLGSVLYALEVPASGGDTIWVSLCAAYDALSSRMKQYLAGMQAEHRTIKAFGDDIRSQLWTSEVTSTCAGACAGAGVGETTGFLIGPTRGGLVSAYTLRTGGGASTVTGSIVAASP